MSIEQLEVFPAISVTVQTTVVVPSGYTSLALLVPLKLFSTDTTLQLSAVEGETTVTLAVHTPLVALTVRLAGQVIVGLILSFRVTLNEHVEEFPLSSVAVIVTGTTVL